MIPCKPKMRMIPFVPSAPHSEAYKQRILAACVYTEAKRLISEAEEEEEEEVSSCAEVAPAPEPAVLLPPVVWVSLYSARRSSYFCAVAQVEAEKKSAAPETSPCIAPVLEEASAAAPLPSEKAMASHDAPRSCGCIWFDDVILRLSAGVRAFFLLSHLPLATHTLVLTPCAPLSLASPLLCIAVSPSITAGSPLMLRSLSCNGTRRSASPASEPAPLEVKAPSVPAPAAPSPVKSWADQVDEDEEEERLAALKTSAPAPDLMTVTSHAQPTPAPQAAAQTASSGVRASAPWMGPSEHTRPAVSEGPWRRPGFREQHSTASRTRQQGRTHRASSCGGW